MQKSSMTSRSSIVRDSIKKRSIFMYLQALIVCIVLCMNLASCSQRDELQLIEVSVDISSAKSITASMDFSNYEIYYKMTPVPDNNVAVGKTTGNFYYHLPETLIVSQGKWQCDIVLILKSQYKQFSDDMKTKISTTPNIWAYEATTTEYINLSNTSLVFKITPTSGDKGFLNINYTANLPTGYNLQTINVSYQKIGSNDLVHSNTPSSSTNNNSQSVFSESRGLDVGKYVAFVNPQLPKKRHSISGSSMNQPAGW